MAKLLILGAQLAHKQRIAALIAQLSEQSVFIVGTTPAMCPTETMVLHAPADMSLHAMKPVNHPDGWYRKFEKRSKQK